MLALSLRKPHLLLDAWNLSVSVNLVGHIKVVTEAIRVFKKQGAPPKSGYSIVTIGSYNVARPQINIAVYSSTKVVMLCCTVKLGPH